MNSPRSELEEFADSRVLQALSGHSCIGCGACCRWGGRVFLYADDIKRLAMKLCLTEEEFLLTRCVALRWLSPAGDQFRIALSWKGQTPECTFLEGARCGIHSFKPLLCKAGPAGWPWISNEKYFWFYERRSPSFRHEPGALVLSEANMWFVATRQAETIARQGSSLSALATAAGISASVISRLEVIEFQEMNIEKEECNVGSSGSGGVTQGAT
jgi:Fe-S-cluster containining protein